MTFTDANDSPEAKPVAATPRSVRRVVPSIETLEGAGFVVHRPFPVGGLDQIDPFLLIDHMGPVDYTPARRSAHPITRIGASRRSATSSRASSSTRTPPATAG